jgi:hypothetical protein
VPSAKEHRARSADHLLPRHVGTPREYCWDRLDERPDAPRGDVHAVANLVERLQVVVDQRS